MGKRMKLYLNNVGMIENAEIELNGITVIAGENNTGKSTVGKMLFCIFNSFLQLDAQVEEERIKSIKRTIYNFLIENEYLGAKTIAEAGSFAEYLMDGREHYMGDVRLIEKELERFLGQTGQQSGRNGSREDVEAVSNKIYNYLCVEDDAVRELILRKRLEYEFGMKVGHVNAPEKSSHVCLDVKNNCIEFSVCKNGEIDIVHYISLRKEAVYIDDPFVLDDLNMEIPVNLWRGMEHRGHLLYQITGERKKREFSALDELIVNQKLQNIFQAMNEVCDGELIAIEEGKRYAYKANHLNGILDMSNVSTGMKSFVLLKALLQNGSIDENGIIILDEPEIHLHPEWQLKFAEIIVLIQKEFKINVLLNTHSPYFLNAIEVYADKYDITEKCKYYLAEEMNGRSRMIDVTLNTEKIYAKLARPLQDLENMEYRDENTI